MFAVLFAGLPLIIFILSLLIVPKVVIILVITQLFFLFLFGVHKPEYWEAQAKFKKNLQDLKNGKK
ncbi:hypothetical protein L5B97_05565 [Avibacterium sp. 20-15]|uniref:hypothetical protein n=1 Tax=unclassified Avibacterium TaxID=2685287 RepID=UPI002025FA2D|nr:MULTISPECIES: hypothetical protein [unclassified Avibacterium]MCW9732957.1 hypothetical protein [Avibacterium sp. 20-15]URL05090.1 hypothetical protein L4F93_04255 [Avibacterium sp. 20-132]